ncbi:hypothetical protein CIPAW_01G084800 [Carya illinoinensis]|uniref:Uncharacterized protein n=1 Tax=Carya illinoinensis TaxID=32201 RepID=A0A8T1RKL1_CARIL|nr:hypothetical protein CIPAW_01G084800 [Carya illinoinensis]
MPCSKNILVPFNCKFLRNGGLIQEFCLSCRCMAVREPFFGEIEEVLGIVLIAIYSCLLIYML